MTRSLHWQGLAPLLLLVACKTSLTAHGDAGRDGVAAKNEVSVGRVDDTDAKDSATARDDGSATVDLPAPDLAPMASGNVSSFRFENQTDRSLYLQVDMPVGCQTRAASTWQGCNFFRLGCLPGCDSVVRGQSCCILCERPEPALYEIPGRSSRVIPWNGFLFGKAKGACSECECQEARLASGEFQATARVFSDYACSSGTCALGADGIIQNASGQGVESDLAVPFTLPRSNPEIVFKVGVPHVLDAGTSADAARVEILADAPVLTLGELSGRTFQIAAADASPDASVPGAASCVPSDPAARYTLAFSADGAKVKVSRADPVQEVDLNGTLDRQSESQIVYRLDAFAGGELIIKQGHVAQLVIFGSGRPVLSCIEAPMKP